MKKTYLSALFVASITLFSCTKEIETQMEPSSTYMSKSTEVPIPEDPITLSAVRKYMSLNDLEWNGLEDPSKIRCYNYPCDCKVTMSYQRSNGETDTLSVPNPFQKYIDEFLDQVENGTITEWYASGRGELINPWPAQQLKDLKSGLVTLKAFPEHPGYLHLVYKNATKLSERPSYSKSGILVSSN
jgi:hypothetical protein